jgi:hypothetical protein
MHLLFTNDQLWILLIGSIVPLGGYVLNHVAPWASETIKGVIQVVLAAAAGALYTALETSVFGWNEKTLSLVFSAVVAALFAHNLLWKPAKVNTRLGAQEHTVPVAPVPAGDTAQEMPS